MGESLQEFKEKGHFFCDFSDSIHKYLMLTRMFIRLEKRWWQFLEQRNVQQKLAF